MDNSNIFSDLYNVSHTMEKDVLPLEFLSADTIFINAIDGVKRWFAEGDEGGINEIFHIVKVNDVEHVGYVIIEKLADDKNVESSNDLVFLEKRIIGRDQRSIYYVTIMCRVVNKNGETHGYDNDIIMLDLISRNMNYVIDCIYHDSYMYLKLCERNHVELTDSLVVLAKTVLLFNSVYGRSVIEKVKSNSGDQTEQFHQIDQVFLRQMRTDWLLSRDIISEDKANVFSFQIVLKQDIYRWCRAIIDSTTLNAANVVKTKGNTKKLSILGTQFLKWYEDMFINGKIYTPGLPSTINDFVVIGSNAYTTEIINNNWKQYI